MIAGRVGFEEPVLLTSLYPADFDRPPADLYDLYPAYAFVLPDSRGKNLSSRSRRVGMDAQMMPTLTSMVDHCDTARLFHVGLLEFAQVVRDCRRTMLMTVTLRSMLELCFRGYGFQQAALTRFLCRT